MILVVVLSVAIIIVKTAANFYSVIICQGNIPTIKKCVEIRLEQQTICHLMRTVFRIWHYMCCFEDRECLFASYRTTSLIRICDSDPKGALPKSVLNNRLSITSRICLCLYDLWGTNRTWNPILNLTKELFTCFCLRGIEFSFYDVRAPIRNRKPIGFLKPKWSRKNSTSDL